MSIEKNLDRIADALEALVQAQGIVPAPAPAVKEKKGKKEKPQTIGKPDPDLATGDGDELTLQDVRAVLKTLRAETSHAQVKSILKSFSASTLKQLDPKNYAAAIAAAEKVME